MSPSPQAQQRSTREESKDTSKNPTAPIHSQSIEEYLEAIFRLLETGSNFAKTGELAEKLQVAPASVTQMVQKLAAKKYVTYEKGRGVRLTNKGRRLAIDVLRRHRIAERLLVDLLGVSWEKAHEVACEWEHILSPELCNRVIERIQDPSTCPHGNPIPEINGSMEMVAQRSLLDLKPHEVATIDCISDESPELLRMMAAMGMLPGESVRVIQISPMGDTLLIEVGTAQFALSRELAKHVRISPEDAG